MPELNNEEMVMLEYVSKRTEKIRIRGRASGTMYKFRLGEQKYVISQDAQYMLGIRRKGLADFILVAAPKELPAASAQTFVQQEVVMAEKPPEFPRMEVVEEKVVTPDDMPRLVKQFKETIPHTSDVNLLKWLKVERGGKARVTVIAMIEEALNERAA